MTIHTQSLPPEADLTALLAPVSEAQEAGRDLDGSFELSAFEMTVREPEPTALAGMEREDERSWSAIDGQARVLLASSKDLRVAVQLARAQLQLHGLYGFCVAVSFVCTLTERYWRTLHPALDADNDPTARLNALQELVSGPMLDQLRSATLATAPGLGPISVKEAIAGTRGSPAVGSPRLMAALSALGAEGLRERLEQVREARRALLELVTFVARETDLRPQLKALSAPKEEGSGLLDAVERLLSLGHEQLSSRAAPAVDAPAVAGPESAAPEESVATKESVSAQVSTSLRIGAGAISCREEVVATLDALCAYYQQAEPASPVPLLLRRARRLVSMDFFAIIRELAREGLPEVERLAGLSAGSEREHAHRPDDD